ncbi:amino acid adenylation domain-containing protein [Candidatus Parabeggiatoa sp. HSG14]|uniref:non-ribosomal peptide synthetase n=1 Tax=Candidatus Parabeggiatoa sp. HSG14 TaxID=3055593 RepID=UPI0025A8C957|nr:amino acid adenylation domain-containing protein [Thiotrichales bacterium HSG14]
MKNIEAFLSDLRELNIHITVKEEKLHCKAPKGKLTPKLQTKLAKHKIEILHFLQQKSIFEQPIQPISRDGELPISFAQQRLWFLYQLEGKSATYNISAAVRLTGYLHFVALKHSLQEIIQRHETLRTTFQSINGKPIPFIHSIVDYQLQVINFQALSSKKQTIEIQRLINEESQYPFDLEKDLLFRATLFQLDTNLHVLLFNMHHIISDGWSTGIFIHEFKALYEAFSQGQSSLLCPLPIQYVDFAHWQKQWLVDEVLEKQINYWKQQLAGAPALLDLPTDRPRLPIQRFRGTTLPLSLSLELTSQLKLMSQQTGATLFMILLSAFAILLYRYSGQSDILIGSPIANRRNSQVESLIGFFVNTLILRIDFSGNPPVKKLLQKIQQVALEAYAHQDIPFEQLVDKLKPVRNLDHTPLFQVMFVLQNAPQESLTVSGLRLEFIVPESKIAKFDLTLSMEEMSQGLTGFIEYNTDLFEQATIERMIGHLKTLLMGIVKNSHQPIGELPLLTEAEKQQFIAWNDTTTDYPRDKTIIDLFEEQVEKTPTNIAVVFENKQLTYQELNSRANQLAHYLQTLGVKPEILVGICVERSLEMIVGLLGILKAGGAYVPLDPTYPKDRLVFMLEDSQIQLLVTQQYLLEVWAKHKRISMVCLDRDWQAISQQSQENAKNLVTPANLAYVIYTSGSTGKPKGVMLEHRGLCHLAIAQTFCFDIQPEDRILQFSSLNFDASIWEIVMALVSGAALYLSTHDILLAGSPLFQLLNDNAITTVTLPPSILASLPVNTLPSLQTIIVAGETCSVELVNRWLPENYFFNAYGPTETTVCATIFTCTNIDQKPPIGHPITNTQVYVLDINLQPIPIGISGELHVGSIGLARGYLNRPELTAEKFIPNPFSHNPNDRLYKTGDLVRYQPDGNLEFLGRVDQQVKIRGFRIELGEIETVLNQDSSVQEAIVIVTKNESSSDKCLLAYIVSKLAPEQTSVAHLRNVLKEKLPDYMIPANFVFLNEMPLTPNGKIDRRALPHPDKLQREEASYVAPQTQIEQKIAMIWQKILHIKKIGIHDNFFDLGGNSLLLMQVHEQLTNALNQNIQIVTLFQYSTISALAHYLDNSSSKETALKTEHTQSKKVARQQHREHRKKRHSI